MSRAPAASVEGLRWRGGEARRCPGCPANRSSLAGWLHDVTMAQKELTAASSAAVHVSDRTHPCPGRSCPGDSPDTEPLRDALPGSASPGHRDRAGRCCTRAGAGTRAVCLPRPAPESHCDHRRISSSLPASVSSSVAER